MIRLFRPIRNTSRRQAYSDYLSEFKRDIESQIASLLEQVMQDWLKQTEVDLQQHLSTLMDHMIQQRMQEMVSHSGQYKDRSWHNTLEQLIGSSIGEWINPSKASVLQRESSRSHSAEQQFRFSRGQQQKAAARTAMQGQRNL